VNGRRRAATRRGAPEPAAAPPVRIRRASAADLEALVALEAGAFDAPWSADQISRFWAGAEALGWIAEAAGGHAVGFALFRAVAGEAELLRIGTEPAWRRRQVGQSLLAAALADLERAGADCHLEVRADNAAAQALYLRLGFALAGVRKRYYRDDCDAWLYARRAGQQTP
jgi:ribosomal-protein-alanine acetyltransferase